MKKTLLNFSISILITFIPGLLLVLLFTFLTQQNIIALNYNNIIIYTLSSICFLVFSFIFALKEKSHGLLHGLILSLIYILLFLIIVKEKDLLEIVFLIVRSLCLIIGSLLGVNLAKN